MRDEIAYYSPSAKEGVLRIRSLSDANVLDAMSDTSPIFATLLRLMGPNTNHSWITAQAAMEAYERNLISTEEMDKIVSE